MNPAKAKVDHGAHNQCRLCGSFCPKVECGENNSVGWGHCFKMLLRYLNIDLVDNSSSIVCDGVRFCEGCGVVMKEFFEWYQNLEAVRLCLSNILLNVYHILRKREDSKVQLRLRSSHEGQFSQGILDSVRNTMMSKCQDKLVSKPRVNLNKIQILEVEKAKTDLKTETILPCLKKEGRPVCKICKKTFSHNCNATQHFIMCHTFLHFSPELPIGTTQSQLENVIRAITEKYVGNSNKRLGCSSCEKLFQKRHLLRLHIITTHKNEIIHLLQNTGEHNDEASTINHHLCDICQKSFKTRGALVLHKKFNHTAASTQKDSTKHSRIGKSSPTSNLERPRKKIQKGKYPCKYCSNTFAAEVSAHRHSLDHHTFFHFSKQLPPHSSQPRLEEAIEIVTKKIVNEKILKCYKCVKTFNHKCNIRTHIIKAHWSEIMDQLKTKDNIASRKPLQSYLHKCDVCKKSFKTRRTLVLHKKYHKEIPVLKKPTMTPLLRKTTHPQNHTCKFCSKTFTLRWNVYRHSIQCHTFLHFSKRLPQGVTQSKFEEAIETITRNHLDEKSLTCIPCKKTSIKRNFVRSHIVKMHWNEIANALGERGNKVIEDPPEKNHAKIESHRRASSEVKESVQMPLTIKEEFPQFYFPSYLGKNIFSSSILPIICNTPQSKSVSPDERLKVEATSSKDQGPCNSGAITHLKSGPEELHKCSYCGRPFKNEDGLTHHLTTIHTRELFENVLPAIVTDKQLRAAVWALIKNSSSTNKFLCKLCSFENSNSSKMKVHVLQNHIDQVAGYLKVKRENQEEDEAPEEIEL